mmetsp:Transcript_25256/g.42297  ORF Transcript_25256/g.42297 Transcript_25256/m.42297 type:complete len:218 (+) Transcript_25256:219-872(+)
MSQFKLNSAPELRWKAMELADTFQRRGQEVQRREQESKANGRRGNESTEVCNEQKCTSFGFTYDELMFEEEHGKKDTNDVWGINEHEEWTRKRNHALMERVSRQRRWDLTAALKKRCMERVDEVNQRRPVQVSRNHEEMKLETVRGMRDSTGDRGYFEYNQWMEQRNESLRGRIQKRNNGFVREAVRLRRKERTEELKRKAELLKRMRTFARPNLVE